MCGAGLTEWACGWGVGAGVRQSGALGSCSPGAAATHAGLSGGFDLDIGSDGFFDYTGHKSGVLLQNFLKSTHLSTQVQPLDHALGECGQTQIDSVHQRTQ